MPYEPEWTDEILGYTMKYLARHEWRVRPNMLVDDMLQEAYILFMRLVERYDFETPSHFMAMWKRSLHNEVWAWAHERSRLREERVSEKVLNNIPEHHNTTAWESHELQASGYVRQLIQATRTRLRRPRRRRSDGTRLTTNEYLCRFAGISTKVPLRRLFEMWLSDV